MEIISGVNCQPPLPPQKNIRNFFPWQKNSITKPYHSSPSWIWFIFYVQTKTQEMKHCINRVKHYAWLKCILSKVKVSLEPRDATKQTQLKRYIFLLWRKFKRILKSNKLWGLHHFYYNDITGYTPYIEYFWIGLAILLSNSVRNRSLFNTYQNKNIHSNIT